ncbi:MAG: GNAT family protein [Acidobacteriota bacterium]
MNIEPVTLKGKFIRLEPMTGEHVDALWEAGGDASLWRLIPTNIASRADMEKYVDIALADRDRGTSLPFVTIDAASNSIIGSTRFGNIDVGHRRSEIGWTWITPKFQRTHVNTEAKLLMLTHAFEVWNCIRVELKTDALNQQSRNAILRIGARQEGIFRNHMIIENGRFRDSVYFSIIESEWTSVKEGLCEKLRSNTK